MARFCSVGFAMTSCVKSAYCNSFAHCCRANRAFACSPSITHSMNTCNCNGVALPSLAKHANTTFKTRAQISQYVSYTRTGCEMAYMRCNTDCMAASIPAGMSLSMNDRPIA